MAALFKCGTCESIAEFIKLQTPRWHSRSAESESPSRGLEHAHFTNIHNEFYAQSVGYVSL